jgi:hypothetical protein
MQSLAVSHHVTVIDCVSPGVCPTSVAIRCGSGSPVHTQMSCQLLLVLMLTLIMTDSHVPCTLTGDA